MRTLLCACAVLTACGSGGAGEDTDTAADGTTASDGNVLAGTAVGGAAEVVAILGVDHAGTAVDTLVYAGDLSLDCASDWQPQGTLCDEAPTGGDRTTSTKTNPNSGATWYARDADGEITTGVIVVDACHDGSCDTVGFDEMVVFQMFSDGKTTALRLSTHPERGDVAPAWDDAGWEAVTDAEPIGAGTQGDAGDVTDPTVVSTGAVTSRYLRIDAQNDGTLGSETYTEIRSVKLFSSP